MPLPRSSNHGVVFGRLTLWAGLVIWTILLVRTPLPDLAGSFMHLVNLPFHEAGHIVFAPFGDFMMSLGGSLLQLLIPLICGWVFLFQQEDGFAAAVCLWWTGESLLDLSPYIDDARSLQLMLLGGPASEVEGHDWEAILAALGWLHLDHSIARLAWYLGAALMIAALIWAARVSFQPLRADAAVGEL
jgi:hypothetical protein